MALFFSFIVSMLITMALIPPLMRSAERLQFVDVPDSRKIHVRNVPRVGGIAMVAGSVLPIVMWLMPNKEVIAFLLGMAIIVIFGVWDDRRNLDYRVKFLGQIIAVLTVMLYGGVMIDSVPLLVEGEKLPVYLSVPITLIFILGITNAINLSDGLDGLAGGTTLLSIGAMAFLGYITDNVMVLLISVAMIGSILGFLRFNTHPAQVFMGDGGSQFLGFSVGVMAVLLTQHGRIPLSPALPLLLLALPIVDTAMVIWQRLRSGHSPFKADKNHFHHKLLAIGLSHYEAVLTIYVIQALLVVLVYLLRFSLDSMVVAAFLSFMASIALFFAWAGRSQWRMPRNAEKDGGYNNIKRQIISLQDNNVPMVAACGISMLAIAAYLIVAVLTTKDVTLDIGALALSVFVIMAAQLVRQWDSPVTWLDQLGIYVLATLAIFLSQTGSGVMNEWRPVVDALFVLLAVGVVIGFGFSRHKHFRLTTLDFLVIFSAVTVPNLPHVTIGQATLGESVAKLIVLFYAAELIMSRSGNYIYAMRPLVMALCLTIGIKAVA